MQTEHSILVVDTAASTLDILEAALTKAGFYVEKAFFKDNFISYRVPDCIVFNLTSVNAGEALRFMSQEPLRSCQRVAMISPHDANARRLAVNIDVDEIIIKPLRIDALIARVALLCERDMADRDRTVSLYDEIDFAQRLQALSDRLFSGRVELERHGQTASLFMDNGTIDGACAGKKQQRIAISSMWRYFPAKVTVYDRENVPPWIENQRLGASVSQVANTIAKTEALFHKYFGSRRELQNIYRINGIQYEFSLKTLPRQVQRIAQRLDGTRTIAQLLDLLHLDDALLIRILRRLIDAQIIVECPPDETHQEVALETWIRAESGKKNADSREICADSNLPVRKSAEYGRDISLSDSTGATQSAIDFAAIAISGDYPRFSDADRVPEDENLSLAFSQIPEQTYVQSFGSYEDGPEMRARAMDAAVMFVPEDASGWVPSQAEAASDAPASEEVLEHVPDAPDSNDLPNDGVNTKKSASSEEDVVTSDVEMRPDRIYTDDDLAAEYARDCRSDESLLNISVDVSGLREPVRSALDTLNSFSMFKTIDSQLDSFDAKESEDIQQKIDQGKIRWRETVQMVKDAAKSPEMVWADNSNRMMTEANWNEELFSENARVDSSNTMHLSGEYDHRERCEADDRNSDLTHYQADRDSHTGLSAVETRLSRRDAVLGIDSAQSYQEMASAGDNKRNRRYYQTQTTEAREDGAECDASDGRTLRESWRDDGRISSVSRIESVTRESRSADPEVSVEELIEESNKARQKRTAAKQQQSQQRRSSSERKQSRHLHRKSRSKYSVTLHLLKISIVIIIAAAIIIILATTKSTLSQTQSNSRAAAKHQQMTQADSGTDAGRELQLQRAREAVRARNYDAARTILETILQEHPDNAENASLQILLGRLYAHDGRIDDAIKQFEAVENARKNNALYWKELAFLYKMAGRLNSASEAMDKAIDAAGSDTPEGLSLMSEKSQLKK